MHESRDGSSAFVFDMMEPERPKVDRSNAKANDLSARLHGAVRHFDGAVLFSFLRVSEFQERLSL
jgi:hypothetical protein